MSGVEEKAGAADTLSTGVPKSRLSWEQLRNAICDRIQPGVAGYVSVFSVQVAANSDGEKLFAFVIDVKPGTTAYQADDKKYYVRRSGQSEPMEDKDIRLRMLAGDKPRIVTKLHPRIVPNVGEFSHRVQFVTWDLSFENVGIRTIPRAIVRSKLNLQGLPDLSCRAIYSGTPEYQHTDFPFEGLDAIGLLPGRRFELTPLLTVSS